MKSWQRIWLSESVQDVFSSLNTLTIGQFSFNLLTLSLQNLLSSCLLLQNKLLSQTEHAQSTVTD